VWEALHTWADVPGGVAVNSSMRVGVALRPAGMTEAAARAASTAAVRTWARGAGPRRALGAWAQHTVEEMGQLVHVLPALYFEDHALTPKHIGWNATAAAAAAAAGNATYEAPVAYNSAAAAAKAKAKAKAAAAAAAGALLG
jgi:hypothetical protein